MLHRARTLALLVAVVAASVALAQTTTTPCSANAIAPALLTNFTATSFTRSYVVRSYAFVRGEFDGEVLLDEERSGVALTFAGDARRMHYVRNETHEVFGDLAAATLHVASVTGRQPSCTSASFTRNDADYLTAIADDAQCVSDDGVQQVWQATERLYATAPTMQTLRTHTWTVARRSVPGSLRLGLDAYSLAEVRGTGELRQDGIHNRLPFKQPYEARLSWTFDGIGSLTSTDAAAVPVLSASRAARCDAQCRLPVSSMIFIDSSSSVSDDETDDERHFVAALIDRFDFGNQLARFGVYWLADGLATIYTIQAGAPVSDVIQQRLDTAERLTVAPSQNFTSAFSFVGTPQGFEYEFGPTDTNWRHVLLLSGGTALETDGAWALSSALKSDTTLIDLLFFQPSSRNTAIDFADVSRMASHDLSRPNYLYSRRIDSSAPLRTAELVDTYARKLCLDEPLVDATRLPTPEPTPLPTPNPDDSITPEPPTPAPTVAPTPSQGATTAEPTPLPPSAEPTPLVMTTAQPTPPTPVPTPFDPTDDSEPTPPARTVAQLATRALERTDVPTDAADCLPGSWNCPFVRNADLSLYYAAAPAACAPHRATVLAVAVAVVVAVVSLALVG